jgi:hypothetical protein
MFHDGTSRIASLLVVCASMLLVACGGANDKKDAKTQSGSPTAAAAVPAELFVAAAPGAPQAIEELKKSAKEGDEVIVRVLVGGEVEPIVDTLASMVVVDVSVPSCAANPEDSCPTPWDFCCVPAEELVKHRATVQAVDAAGKPLKASFAAGQKIKPHDTLVVKGKVGPRPDPKVFVINATGIFVESSLKQK